MNRQPPVMVGMTFESDCIVNGKLIKAGTKIPFAAPSSAADLVPVNWLDPLLTGPTAVLQGSGPWGCPDIERLLLAVREKVSAATGPRWIPVDERLPEDDRPVAVLAKELEDNAAIANYCAPFWMVQASAADDDINVTHWCDCIPNPKVPA